MKRIALVFLLAILVPALLLAGLALRSLRDQEWMVDTQRAALLETTCEELSTEINLYFDDLRIFYGGVLGELSASRANPAESWTNDFDNLLRERWSQAAVGAVVSDEGSILAPSLQSKQPRIEAFLLNNQAFFNNDRATEVYQAPRFTARGVSVEEESREEEPSKARPAEPSLPAVASLPVKGQESPTMVKQQPPARQKVAVSSEKFSQKRFEAVSPDNPAYPATKGPPDGVLSESVSPVMPSPANIAFQADAQARNVAPTQSDYLAKKGNQELTNESASPPVISSLNRSSYTQIGLTSDSDEGAVSRIIDGNLHILLWRRLPQHPARTFWVELDLPKVTAELASLFANFGLDQKSKDAVFVLLDTQGKPVAKSSSDFEAAWSTPLVASEVGQILPRWEVAAYLRNPESLNQSARTARLSLGLTTLVLLGAVIGGTVLILQSVNYEMRLASRKTDFVGNVSHELKTPLTSIRMFSELLERDGISDESNVKRYAGVIASESARLARLIERLLDFSRLDRGEMRLREDPIDLVKLVEDTVAVYKHSRLADTFAIEKNLPTDPVMVHGDSDALSQVLVNLLSNAEKYAAAGREALVDLTLSRHQRAQLVVHDRGEGITSRHQRKIFERFYRIDDSISSGIDGSGIGLALCQQIVIRHGGAISYRRRPGGGSSFVVELPIAQSNQDYVQS
jgi:two-component system, OmpR family, phosphate regulon sensor histidine kinase PhoR